MSILSNGTVSGTNGTNIINGVSTSFLTSGVVIGDWFKIDGDPLPYIIAAVVSDTVIHLQNNYAGVTFEDSEYQILTDFYLFNIAKLFPDMVDSFDVMNKNYQIIADKLGIAGASAVEYQVTTRFYLGEPIQGKEFGFLTWNNDAQIDKITLSTDYTPPDNNLVLDVAINGVYQSLNLTLPAGSTTVQSSTLTYQISSSNIVKFKWNTVTLPAGSDYFIDIQWHATTALTARYDFIRCGLGELLVNTRIGNGYYPPVKSIYYGLSYELTYAPEGSTIILELLKNGASLGTPVTVTIPVASTSGYLTHSQTTFETTDTCSWKVTQTGSIFPGSDIILTGHSFRTE